MSASGIVCCSWDVLLDYEWHAFGVASLRMTAMESFRRQIMTDFMAKVDRGTASEASSSTPSTPMRGQQGDSGSVASIGLSNFINAKPSTMGQVSA